MSAVCRAFTGRFCRFCFFSKVFIPLLSYMLHMKDTHRISLRLPSDTFDVLNLEKKQSGNGISSIIRTAIKEHIDRVGREAEK